jgi:hypothetical protein
MQKELSIPIPNYVLSANRAGVIDTIIQNENNIGADILLDSDKHIVVFSYLDSDEPLRIFSFPTIQEAKETTRIITAKIGAMETYWREIANTIIAPDKLWRHSIIETSIVPAFIDDQNSIRLILHPLERGKNYRLFDNSRYKKTVYTINWGGDNDFFATINARKIKLNKKNVDISTSMLGIPNELLDMIIMRRENLDHQSDIVFSDVVTQMLQEPNTQQNIFKPSLYKMLVAIHNVDLITAGWKFARIVFTKKLPLSDDELDTILDEMNSRFKQRLLDEGKDGQVWLAADALATSMQELYETAKAHVD